MNQHSKIAVNFVNWVFDNDYIKEDEEIWYSDRQKNIDESFTTSQLYEKFKNGETLPLRKPSVIKKKKSPTKNIK